MLRLPRSLRSELKTPLGTVYTDPKALERAAGTPIVAVGDVVTEHLLSVTVPSVAVVDNQTKRTPLDTPVDLSPFDRQYTVDNPAATLTRELLETLTRAVQSETSASAIVVDGEEDLAALPAVIAVPPGGSVVYGQPDEGMVLIPVDATAKTRMRELLSRMDGDHATALQLLSE